MFAVRITFITFIFCEARAFGLRRSKEYKAGNLSRRLHSTPAMLPKPQDRQGKGSQQRIKSIAELSRGTSIHGSPRQVLSFPSHHSPNWGKKISNLICSLHLNLPFGCRGPGWHREYNLRAPSLMLGKFGPLYNPLSVCITLHIEYILRKGDSCTLNNIHMLPRRYFLFSMLLCH